ncbi:MAG: hypothetical protein MUC86_00530 [Burkholderiaceae bacterium]|jgi:hypothetical protein|nr:hypothetical protein [Burkholderiaceae bacterium]
MQAMLAAGDLDPEDMPDCCNDLQTFAQTGHTCKAGTDCSVPTAIAPASLAGTADAAAPTCAPEASATAVLPAPTATPWRPPARH